MLRPSNQLRYLSAAGVLALGTACAANVYLKPPTYNGPDPVQLRQLADRVSTTSSLQETPLYVPPVRRSRPTVTTTPVSRRQPAPAVTVNRPAPVEPPSLEESKPAPEVAVKQIALTGVTQQGDTPTAWLVDISTNERETAALGDSAFGFVVKEIGAESVLLAQDGEEFTVWMGDKEIPVTEPETPPVANLTPPTDNNGQRGWGRRGFNNFNRGGGGNWSGRWSGGSGWSGNRNWSRGGSSNNFSQSGFRGNLGGFGGFSGQNSNQRNNRNSTLNRPTSNPQEARRRGGRLMGGATPLPTPANIQNPQTSRRRGTNSGRAFGSDPNWR